MTTRITLMLLAALAACSNPGAVPTVAAPAIPPSATVPAASAPAVPSAALRSVTWSASVAGPKRSDLASALDKPLAQPWDMFDRKTKRHQRARTCRHLLALDPTSRPMDAGGDGSSPTDLGDDGWNIYAEYLVGCRITVAIQAAKPAQHDYIGAFPLDEARLNEIPAAVIPTPSDDEEAQLKKASARGVSWRGWDRAIHVTKTDRWGVTVENPDTDTHCLLSVYARGDFDGDGIEDLVLWRSGHGEEGTWASTAAFVLTRRSPHGRVEIVKVIE